MIEDQEKISQRAIDWIKTNISLLIDKFANDVIFPSQENPISVFMAGSPGAGKTEFSKNLLESFKSGKEGIAVRIDPDDIRDFLPEYDGKNSFIFQGATSIAVDKLHDYVLKKKKNFILDGTFSHFEKSYINVKRSIDKGRPVRINYIYQDPFIAWDFTKKREALEGRNIPKEAFVNQFFAARDVVNKVKDIFKDRIEIDLVIKDYKANTEDIKLNISRIDNYIQIIYTPDELLTKLL